MEITEFMDLTGPSNCAICHSGCRHLVSHLDEVLKPPMNIYRHRCDIESFSSSQTHDRGSLSRGKRSNERDQSYLYFVRNGNTEANFSMISASVRGCSEISPTLFRMNVDACINEYFSSSSTISNRLLSASYPILYNALFDFPTFAVYNVIASDQMYHSYHFEMYRL